MTEPEPFPTDPLFTLERLAIWAQERPLLDAEFADLIIEAVSELVREAGDRYWTIETLPARARDIGYVVAKDYYLNPTLIRQESLGPLQETRSDNVLQGLALTEAQAAEIAGLVTPDPTEVSEGLWSFQTTRGPVEMSQQAGSRTAYLYDTRGAWPIPYLTEEQSVVFFPEEV